ncbi:MAG: pyroglutamyl-peptidase I [Planctomycetota bacterium]
MIERILITGFEPFGDHQRNVSGDAMDGLDGRTLDDGFELRARTLPVQFERATAQLADLLEREQPVAALACGIHGAPGGPFRLEVAARNERNYGIPDTDGVLVRDGVVVEGGPAQVFSTAPVATIKQRLQDAGFEVELSDDAGRYLCNAVFYWLAQRVPMAGFLHVPPDATRAQVQQALALAAEAAATRLLAQRVDAVA